MKKNILCIVNVLIFILCFLFLLSSFFKLVSYTHIEKLLYEKDTVLLSIWGIGLIISIIFTRPLYRWILHFRLLNSK